MDKAKPFDICTSTAEHRQPCEPRGSSTVLGAPGGEIPPGDSPIMRPISDTRVRSLAPGCSALFTNGAGSFPSRPLRLAAWPVRSRSR